MTLTHNIEICKKCISLTSDNRLKIDNKPYVKFQVETKWKPKTGIKVLFIAESPPWNGNQRYFYHEIDEKRTNLRKEVLRHLNLKNLKEFKEEGYFLIDAIKCRINKKGKKKVPKQALKDCSDQFLMKEITNLKPQTIFVLGKSAKQALQQHPEFLNLQNHKVTEDYDNTLSKYRIILSIYPGGQTRIYESKIKNDFSKIIL